MTDLSKRTRAPKGVHDGGQLRPERRKANIAQIEDWKSSGFTEWEAERWISSGFTLQDAMEWRSGDFGPLQAEQWVTSGFQRLEAGYWVRTSTSPAFERFHFPNPNDTLTDRQIQFAKAWLDKGIDVNTAFAWSMEDFSPSEAESWLRSKTPLRFAEKYRDAGYRP